jgi:hypothetical protein
MDCEKALLDLFKYYSRRPAFYYLPPLLLHSNSNLYRHMLSLYMIPWPRYGIRPHSSGVDFRGDSRRLRDGPEVYF